MPYAVQIKPDPRLRRLLLACGALLYALGAALLIGLPLALLPKFALLAAWLAHGAVEWRRQARGYRRVAGIRIRESGALDCIDSRGKQEPAGLMGGSFVLRRLAWLRLNFADGSHYGELLSGDAQRHPAWHGLQLTWAQCRHRFGRLD